MKIMKTKTMSIIPNKSLMIKMGQKNYAIEQALAEFIDNSIDAKIDDKILNIDITFTITQNDPVNSSIIIQDDAIGMDEDTFKNSAILGKSSKQNQLGLFGLGLKSASQNLAHNYTIETTKLNNRNDFKFSFNEQSWMSNTKISWDNYPYSSNRISPATHGTKITLSNLRTNITNQRRLITRVIDDYAYRYGRLIEDDQIIIKINGENVTSRSLSFESNSKIDFDFLLDEQDPTTRICGSVGLNFDEIAQEVRGSQIGKYGFSTYRNNRLITQNDALYVDKATFAIKRHPTWASIIGYVDMDCVSVDSDKRGFIRESPLYVQAVNKIREYVVQIETLIRAREKESVVSSNIEEETGKIVDAAEDVIKERDFQELITKYNEDDMLDEISQDNDEEVIITRIKRKRTNEDEDGLKEVRDKIPKIEEIKSAVEPSDDPSAREPREKTVEGTIKKVVEENVDGSTDVNVKVDNKDFKFKHYYVDNIEGDLLRSWELVNDKVFVVKTNVKYFRESTGNDYPVFALNNICECYSEYILKTTDDGNNIVVIRDEMIKRLYKHICSYKFSN